MHKILGKRKQDDDWTASIFHTSDGGQNWTRQILPDNASLLGRIDFIDSRAGWAAGAKRLEQEDTRIGHAGAVYSTRDGGKTWEEQYSSGEDVTLTAIDFVDSSHGWVTGFPTSSALNEDFVFHASDGGKTWAVQYENSPPSGDLFSYHRLSSIYFVDQQNGWALATKRFPSQNIFLAHTTDSGELWSWVDTGISGNMAIGYALVQGDLEIIDRNNFWAAGGLGEVVHLQDGGVTWRKQNISCGYPTCPIRMDGWWGRRDLCRTGVDGRRPGDNSKNREQPPGIKWSEFRRYIK